MNEFKQLIRFGNQTQNQKRRAIDFISNLIIVENLEYECIVKKYTKSKTTAQLGYYWGVVIMHFMVWQGCTSKEADQCLKEELMPPVIKEIMGKPRETRVSIAEMKVGEMSKYIDLCVNFLGSWGVNVPPPPYKEQQ